MNRNNCPCGSGKPANDCCLPIIKGRKPAQTAEELMRSRYSAFTLADGAYLMKSHHPETRPSGQRREIEAWAKSVQWMGLSVLDRAGGGPSDATGMVEFRALYLEVGKMEQIHEKSHFKKVNGEWFYHSGLHY